MSLTNEDLKGTILPKISIDQYEPNAGETKEIIVVAFYLRDKGPADDLNTFIQRGAVENLDVEVSPNTDEDGNYLVFVEMLREEDFPRKFKELVNDVENLSGKLNWKITTYLSGEEEFELGDERVFKFVILNPGEYVTKSEFNIENDSDQEKVFEFFNNSLISNLTINENYVTVMGNNRQVTFEVVDVGEYDTIILNNKLTESAFKMEKTYHEAQTLKKILGNYEILPINEFISISTGDKIMLVKNTQITYKGGNFG